MNKIAVFLALWAGNAAFFCLIRIKNALATAYGQPTIFTGEWTAIQAMLPTQPYTVEQCISVAEGGGRS
ncbi:hypothetical protein [Paenibacillus sp. yr247]|uniref:hypothetical protein n=1 Tax=Paenibacillus sp. yr247 TaxID=1761880 RepID=UPI001587B01B|nr:hypothetical protein [Paenibacillus sp. yr247]